MRKYLRDLKRSELIDFYTDLVLRLQVEWALYYSIRRVQKVVLNSF